MKIILFLLISFKAHAANVQFTGSFYQVNNNSSWARNGSTLDLDFSNDRYSLNGTTYSNIASFITAAGATFSRSTTARYYNSSGILSISAANTPRLDYDPNTHEPKGILIEEVRTNDLLRSEELDNVYWSKSNLIVSPNATTAPDGTMTAELLTATGASNTYLARTEGTYAAGTAVTRSIYAKPSTTSTIVFEAAVSGPGYIPTIFNLSTLTVTQGSGVTAKIQNVGNGWYRLSATKTFANSSVTDRWSAIYVDVYGTAAAGKSIYLWGAQQEIGLFATSYIPTTSTTATRAKDNFSIPTAAWFNSTTGTFITQNYGQLNSNQPYYGRIIGGDNPMAFIGFSSTLSAIGTWNGTTSFGKSGTVTSSISQSIKMAHSWDQNTMTQSVSISNSQLASGTYAGTWASTKIFPGGSDFDPLNTSVMRLTFFPTRLSDAGLLDFTR